MKVKNDIEALIKASFVVYMFLMPFTSAFALTGAITLPVMTGMFLFLGMFLKIILLVKLPKGFLGEDLLLVFSFIFLVWLSYFVNGLGNAKSLNHAIAYSTTFLVFYISIKFTLFSFDDVNKVIKRVLEIITMTCLVSAVYTVGEFISFNFFGVNFNDFIPRPSEADMFYIPTGLDLFFRARGFASESGHYAFMMEIFTPLIVYYFYFSQLCKCSKWVKAASLILIFFSVAFTLSTSTILIVPISMLITMLFYFKNCIRYIRRNSRSVLINLSIILAIFLVLNYFFSLNAYTVTNLVEKFNSSSYYDRLSRVNFFYNKFGGADLINKLIGLGPGAYYLLGFDESRSMVSLYYNTTFELGIIGSFILFLFFCYGFIKVLRIKGAISFFLFFSLLSGALHYYIIGNYWYPWFWFIFAVTIFVEKNKLSIIRERTNYL